MFRCPRALLCVPHLLHRLRYEERASLAQNALGRQLLELMARKKTNLSGGAPRGLCLPSPTPTCAHTRTHTHKYVYEPTQEAPALLPTVPAPPACGHPTSPLPRAFTQLRLCWLCLDLLSAGLPPVRACSGG